MASSKAVASRTQGSIKHLTSWWLQQINSPRSSNGSWFCVLFHSDSRIKPQHTKNPTQDFWRFSLEAKHFTVWTHQPSYVLSSATSRFSQSSAKDSAKDIVDWSSGRPSTDYDMSRLYCPLAMFHFWRWQYLACWHNNGFTWPRRKLSPWCQRFHWNHQWLW